MGIFESSVIKDFNRDFDINDIKDRRTHGCKYGDEAQDAIESYLKEVLEEMNERFKKACERAGVDQDKWFQIESELK